MQYCANLTSQFTKFHHYSVSIFLGIKNQNIEVKEKKLNQICMDQREESKHIFNFNWETVIKGFWNKYPCPELDFVKWNKVVDIVENPDDTMMVKRLVLVKKFNFMWCLTMEEIKLDFNNKMMEMVTKVVTKSQMFPNVGGLERVVYKQYNRDSTLYYKLLKENSQSNILVKYASLFNNSFQKGIKVIENKCHEFYNYQ